MIDSGFQDVLGQAKKLLNDSPFTELRQVTVEQNGDVVCLKGIVATYFMKQLAQETVRSATRGLEVSNELNVGTLSMPVRAEHASSI